MPRGKSNVSRTERRPDRVARSLFIINRDCETSNNRDRNGWREQRQCSGHLEIPLLSQMTFARCVLRKWAVGNYTYFIVRHTLLVALRKYHFEFPSSTRVDIEHNLARTMPDFNVRSRENGHAYEIISTLSFWLYVNLRFLFFVDSKLYDGLNNQTRIRRSREGSKLRAEITRVFNVLYRIWLLREMYLKYFCTLLFWFYII